MLNRRGGHYMSAAATLAVVLACVAGAPHAQVLVQRPRLVNATEPTAAQRDSILRSLPAEVRAPIQFMERGGMDGRTFARVARARARIAAGEVDSGLVVLRAVIDEHPGDINLLHMYVDELLHTGHAEDAASFLSDRLSESKTAGSSTGDSSTGDGKRADSQAGDRRPSETTVDAWDLRGQLARAQFLSGHKGDADKSWAGMLALRPQDELTYRQVAGERLSVRDFDGAEQVYAAGRKAIGRPDAFALELENLHKSSNRLDAAMDDCMQLLRGPDGFQGWVGEELVSLAKMSMQPGAGGSRTAQVTNQLVTLARAFPEHLELRTTALRVLLVQDRGAAAVAFALQIDRDRMRRQDTPSALIMLSQLAQESGDSTTARLAARQGISAPLQPADAVAARWILAREAESQGRLDDALAMYRDLAGRADSVRASTGGGAYDRATVMNAVTEAPMRVAALELRRGHAVQAIAAYEAIIAAPGLRPAQAEQARVALADCYLAIGRTGEAKTQYDQIAKTSATRAVREHAAFGLGEAAFFAGDYKDAGEHYRALTDVFPEGASVNDALSRILLMAECQQDASGLARYASAERQLRAARTDSALVTLKSLAAGAATSPVTPVAAFRVGDVLLMQQRAADAAAIYAAVADSFPESRQAPDALRAEANVYADQLGQPAKALDLYTRFLTTYPTNVFTSDVRARAEKIRRPPGKAS